MISSLLFLMMILLLASATPSTSSTGPYFLQGFLQSIVAYLITLALIAIQSRARISRIRLLLTTQLELIAYVALFQFYFQGYLVFTQGPLAFASTTLLTLLLLVLYFFGLAFFYFTYKTNPDPFTAHLRLTVPFCVPFVLFCVLMDLSALLPPFPALQQLTPWEQLILFVGFSLIFFGLVLAFIPPFTVRLWLCQPIQDSALRQRLENLCQRTGFRCGGMLTWNMMRGAVTAAIMGVFPRYRYVIFTQGLLDKLSPASIEAVLAHEIGHNRYKHLLLYPLIICGMIPVLGLYDAWVSPLISSALETHQMQSLGPFIAFATAAVILLVYFRLIFGFFSRLFERQADLFVFEAGVDPQDMVSALDSVAIHSGYTHHDPSWHHHSIQERMNLLLAAQEDPSVITRHHRSVRLALIVYVLALIAAWVLLLGPGF